MNAGAYVSQVTDRDDLVRYIAGAFAELPNQDQAVQRDTNLTGEPS